MELFEKITKVFFAVLFSGVLILLAVETAVRRRMAERRRERIGPLDLAYLRHPKTRPTITGTLDWEETTNGSNEPRPNSRGTSRTGLRPRDKRLGW